MVIEEPSVIAAASNAAKLLREGSGIITQASPPVMIGQIQLCDVSDPETSAQAIRNAAPELLAKANASQPRLVARGGGARELTVRVFSETEVGAMVIVHIMVDVCDAMGANLVNAMAETLAPDCEALAQARTNLRILSNLADKRLVEATGKVPIAWLARPQLGLDGATVAARIEEASVFAEIDPYRAATHNKGMMNGIDAFLIATGQDWRAVEAGIHAYGARHGTYSALATWRREGDYLVGKVVLPMQVGTVGGVTKVHPVVKVLLEILEMDSASDVGRCVAAVGLAQNLAAIMALATEGIQRGHMSLHARNIAASVGASGRDIDHIVAEMIRRENITHEEAKSILDESLSAPSSGSTVTFEDLEALRDDHWPQIEACILDRLQEGNVKGSLDDMVRYQISTGGKRLRALIPLAIQKAMGQDIADIIPFAAAMELVHNATLVHADAEKRHRIRRGKATLWVRYGLDQAINCGDGLFYLALQCLEKLNRTPQEIAQIRSTILEQLLSVVRAQIDDRRMEHESDGSPEDWLRLARDRIGGLFKMAVLGATRIAGGTGVSQEGLEEIGAHLGVIFLVQDDLMDLLATRSQNRRGQSIIDGKLTLLLTHFLHHANTDARNRIWHILNLPAADTTDSLVTEVLQALHEHGSLDEALRIIREEQTQLEAHLSAIPAPLASLFLGMTDIFLAPLRHQLSDS
jgi:hydroxymethylglutaryl-CoA reductase